IRSRTVTGVQTCALPILIEKYSHVMHIVSKVTGQLRQDLRPIAALRATFPAGTVSGAPKIRAMEIIAEIEPDRRGTYAGAVGFRSEERRVGKEGRRGTVQ